jgi:energy-coupling factor transporter ATP-binding protein EcfA2
LQAALDLAKVGIKVFPVTPDKDPLAKWKTEATTNPKKIRAWWRWQPDAMPAFATGEESGIDVLDLDRKDGKDGFKALDALGIDPASLSWVIVETASGGWHLYFARKPGLRCSVGQGDLAGVDVRADRGFVVAPGAVNAKGCYSFLKGGLADLDQEARQIAGLASWPAGLPMQARVRSGAGDDKADPSGLPLAVLQSALMAIPIAAREEAFGTDLAWFKVARIIYDETGGSEEGNEVWHEWSEGWGGYDYHLAEDKWNREGTYDGERATVWAIILEAERHGWRDKTVIELRRLEAAEEANADFDLVWQYQHPDGEQPVTEDRAESAALTTAADMDDWGAPMMQGDKPINNQHNAILYLGRNLDSILPDLAHNEMTHRDEWRGGEVTDSTVVLTRAQLERRGLKTIGKELVSDAVSAVARHRQFHPVRETLNRLAHDGGQRLDSWLVRLAGAEDTPYTRAVGRKFLLQMVARVMEPGCKADHTLVLIGPQGAGKSALCRLLAGAAYFTDTLPAITGGKDVMEHLQGVWLAELAELAPSRKSEAEDLKAFLTGTVDRFRVAYGKRTESFPRQNVFVGTTNDDEFLRDSTGGRRFWPVHVGKIDLDGLAAERDQLFAEAVAAYRAGESWWMEAAFEEAHARPMQDAARVRDSWAEDVVTWLNKPVRRDLGFDGPGEIRAEVTASEVMAEALGLTSGQQTMAIQKRVADVLKGLGWVKGHTRRGNVWKRPPQ